MMLTTWKIGPALAAGNTVVVKPPEWAPLTCSLLADIARDAGVPDGVLNVVQGIGEEAGAALVAHPDLDRISFTGSTDTAKSIGQAAARSITPLARRARRQVAVHRLRRRRPRCRRADRRGPVRERRPGLPGGHARAGRAEHRRRVPRQGARRLGPHDGGRPARPEDARRAADHARALRARVGLRRARGGGGRPAAVRRRARRGGRALLPADALRPREARLRDLAARGVRAGAHLADLHERRRGRRARQRHPLRARGRPVQPEREARDGDRRARRRGHASG